MLQPHEAGWAIAPELAPPPGRSSLTLAAYLHALRRHWVKATAIGGSLAVVAWFAVWLLVGPEYRASAYLQVRRDLPSVFGGVQRVARDEYETYRDTQPQILTNPWVLREALSTEVPDEQQNLHKPADLALLSGEKDQVDWLQEEIRVHFPGDAEIMEISLVAGNPEEAAIVVNAVVKAYMEEVFNTTRRERNERRLKLDQIVAEKDVALRKMRDNQQRLAISLGTGDPDALALKQKIAIQEWADFQRQLATTDFHHRQALADLKAQEALLAAAPTIKITKPELDAALRNDPYAAQLARELALRGMDEEYTRSRVQPYSNSPHALRYLRDKETIQMQYDELGREVADGLREMRINEYTGERDRLQIQADVLAEQATQLVTEVAAKRKVAEDLGRSSIDYQMQDAEIKNLENMLAQLQEERERIIVELESALRIEKRVDAVPPLIQDNLTVRVGLAVFVALLGLCLPAGVIAWWDSRKRRINSVDDVSHGLGVKVIGSVPRIPTRVIHQLGTPSRRNQTWQLRLTESVDTIVARLLCAAESGTARVVLVSSASGGEGKTTLATQLAMSLARNGRRTALVDFDLRRPAFDEVFGLPLEPGVSEILRRQSECSAAVRSTGTDNLSVVTAGQWDRVALAALANGAAEKVFETLREQFEFVVVDASPILPVADTRFVAQHVDSVILSVFRDVSESPKVQAACEVLEAFGVSDVEAVVTGHTEKLRDSDLRYQVDVPE